MTDRKHEKFLRLREALQAKAKQEGNIDLASAVEECLLKVTGGDPDCPFGALLLQDYVESGTIPNGGGHPAKGDSSPPSVQIPDSTVIDRLQALLVHEAEARRDDPYIQALQACHRLMQSDPQCPFFRLMHGSPPEDPQKPRQ